MSHELSAAALLGPLLFGVLLSSGSALGAFGWKRKYEEILPITGLEMALLLFLFGIFGKLSAGFYTVLGLAVLAWGAALVCLVCAGEGVGARMKAFFSPNFFLFALLYAYLFLLNRGRLAAGFDELSHWADAVKAMTQLNVLNADPLAGSTFQSYPPGLALFQYCEQRMALLCRSGGFDEGLLYHGFQVFLAMLLLPFLKDLDYRRLYAWPVAAACLLAPGFLFDGVWTSLMVDPQLGVLTAAGTAAICLRKPGDRAAEVFALLCMAMLSLTKPIGVFFALLTALVWAAAARVEQGAWRVRSLAGFAAALLPWALWQGCVRWNRANVAFSNPVRLGELINILLGRDDSYRKTVRDLFLRALNETESTGALLGIRLSYPLLTALLLTALLFAGRRLVRRAPEKAKLFSAVWLIQALGLAVYLFGLLVMYLFKFGEYEAMRLASFQRYLAIPLTGIWILAVLLTAGLFRETRSDRSLTAAVLLTVTLALVPSRVILSLTNRSSVAETQALRAPFNELYESFAARYSGEPARLYLVSQGGTEYTFFLNKFSFRPNRVSSPMGWNIAPQTAGEGGWRQCEPDELREALLNDFDFLILYEADDSFRGLCADLFPEGESIRDHSVYAVDREAGLLRWYCGAETGG